MATRSMPITNEQTVGCPTCGRLPPYPCVNKHGFIRTDHKARKQRYVALVLQRLIADSPLTQRLETR